MKCSPDRTRILSRNVRTTNALLRAPNHRCINRPVSSNLLFLLKRIPLHFLDPCSARSTKSFQPNLALYCNPFDRLGTVLSTLLLLHGLTVVHRLLSASIYRLPANESAIDRRLPISVIRFQNILGMVLPNNVDG